MHFLLSKGLASAAPAVFIPTGLYIQSSNSPDPILRRFLGKSGSATRTTCRKSLPKAHTNLKPKNSRHLKEVYRKQLGNEEVTGWTFHAALPKAVVIDGNLLEPGSQISGVPDGTGWNGRSTEQARVGPDP